MRNFSLDKQQNYVARLQVFFTPFSMLSERGQRKSGHDLQIRARMFLYLEPPYRSVTASDKNLSLAILVLHRHHLILSEQD